MNIKDRLNTVKQKENVISPDKNKADFFKLDNAAVSDIISEQISNLGNVIFITDKTINNLSVVRCFEEYIGDLPKKIIKNNIFDDNDIENSTVNIFPEITGQIFINVLEQMLFGVKSFVIGIHLNSYENVLEKLKTIISVNSNIKESFINVLLSASNALVVNVETDEKGLLYVKNIDKIQTSNSEIYLNSLYEFIDKSDVAMPADKREISVIAEEEKQIAVENEQEEQPADAVKKDKKQSSSVTADEEPAPSFQNEDDNPPQIEEQPADTVKKNKKLSSSITADEEPAPSFQNEDDNPPQIEEQPADTAKKDKKKSSSVTADEEPAPSLQDEDDNPPQIEEQPADTSVGEEGTMRKKKVNKYKLLKEKIKNKKTD